MPTKIAWTDETWNPITGCTPVSEACKFCYAKRMTERFGGDFSKVTLHPGRLEIPLRWRKPRQVFVCSMGDLFHEDVPDEFIDRVFATMALAYRHTFQVLTKRPERMRDYMSGSSLGYTGSPDKVPRWVYVEGQAQKLYEEQHGTDPSEWLSVKLPLPNVWLMVSVENQKAADERLPILMETSAAVRGVSLEPLLGPLSIEPYLPVTEAVSYKAARGCLRLNGLPRLDWVIVGGESGGPEDRRLVYGGALQKVSQRPPLYVCTASACEGFGHYVRPSEVEFHRWHPKPDALEWVRSILRQAQDAGVPCFFKQWGPRAGQGTLVDGREHREMPR